MEWWGTKLGFTFFAATTLAAASYIGYLFGWVSGSSMTPVVATIAPLILGLLAGLGLTTGIIPPPSLAAALDRITAFASLGDRDRSKIKTELASMPNYWQLGVMALALLGFSVFCEYGFRVGGDDRDDPYPPLSLAIEGWGNVDIPTRTEVYELRWRMQKAGTGGTEFWNFAVEVIAPILSDETLSDAAKAERLKLLADRLPTKAENR